MIEDVSIANAIPTVLDTPDDASVAGMHYPVWPIPSPMDSELMAVQNSGILALLPVSAPLSSLHSDDSGNDFDLSF